LGRAGRRLGPAAGAGAMDVGGGVLRKVAPAIQKSYRPGVGLLTQGE
jgi:hypothetical protein